MVSYTNERTQTAIKTVDVFGVGYGVVDYSNATDLIIENAQNHDSFSVFALPVHGVIEARKNESFSEGIQRADLIVPDGQPIKWVMNWLGECSLRDRVYGPKLVECVLRRADSLGLNVFVYGGATDQILTDFCGYINNDFPNVKIVGSYREKSVSKTTLTSSDVQRSKAHIVLCGLGLPVQEIWISENKTGSCAVLMGVGAAFSFLSGHTRKAPEWMQNSGLEWLFRLASEPSRLWKRYLITNTYFIVLVINMLFRRVFRRD